jgi:crotonobetainyl-CoA:carnitine CoA-transferase CaiB-like acyl-CoA transferase
MDKALSDVTVLDLGQVIAMPFCTMLLADLGARVIKVESRERGQERMSLDLKRVRNGTEERVPVYQYRERNKLAITLDLKQPKGVELFKELVKQVDVVSENFSVGTMERLGLGYEALKQWTSQRPKAEVVHILSQAGVPAAPVNNVAEMVGDPQVQARDMFVELTHPVYGPVKITGTPLKLSETPGRVERLAALPGEHNEDIFLGLLGHTKEELAQWQAAGII